MELTFLASFYVAFTLHIWFDTNFFVEYMTLLKLDKWCQIGDYIDSQTDWSYPEFLFHTYDKYFIVRLITCPSCFSVWLALLFTGAMILLRHYSIENILFFPPISLLGLIIYYSLKKLI